METVQIAEFGSVHEARIAQGLLHAHGIEALARIEDAGGNYPQLAAQVRGGTGVHVPLAQVPDARRLLQQHTRAADGLLAIFPREQIEKLLRCLPRKLLEQVRAVVGANIGEDLLRLLVGQFVQQCVLSFALE